MPKISTMKKRKKRTAHKSKMITGYIIYASEIRKDVIKKFPDRDFGDISKLVGIEWKNLPQEVKVAYEKRAQDQNARTKATLAAEALLKQQQLDISNLQTSVEGDDSLISVNGARESLSFTSSTSQHGSGADNNNLSQHIIQSTPMKNSQSQPLQIIQHHMQPIVTTVQYCKTNKCYPNPSQQQMYFESSSSSSLQSSHKKNSIVYRKPATVRLRPKDATTQTDAARPAKAQEPKTPLRFSQKFIDYLASSKSLAV